MRGYAQRVNFRCHRCNKRSFTKQNMTMVEGHLICSDCHQAWSKEQDRLHGPKFWITYRLQRGKIDRHAWVRAIDKDTATDTVLAWDKVKEVVSVESEEESNAKWEAYVAQRDKELKNG